MKQILIFFCMIFASCTFEYDEPNGLQGDTIKFSKKELSFSAQGGLDTVTSQGIFWWIASSMSIDGKRYGFMLEDSRFYHFKTEDGENYVKDEDEGEIFVAEYSNADIKKLEGAWFTVDKATKQMLTFAVAPNATGNIRTLSFGVEAGNYGTNIRVTQAAE
ncbi:MAG: hypothetical protein LBJ57_07415 [Prevotellaceae bacterium]|jgi:hypothetical protein|nr:hypothetical protein [Prevotellaceae bacterium]